MSAKKRQNKTANPKARPAAAAGKKTLAKATPKTTLAAKKAVKSKSLSESDTKVSQPKFAKTKLASKKSSPKSTKVIASKTAGKKTNSDTKPSPKTVSKKAPAKKIAATDKKPAKPLIPKKTSPKPLEPKSSMAKTAKKLGSTTTASRPLKKSATAIQDNDKFRQLLLSVRSRLIGDVNMMSQEALGGSDGAADNHAPIHPAEVGTHSFEQEFTLNLLSSDGDRLDRIEAALEKIGDGTYGSCDECGSRIPKARLEVIPDTPFCVKCATRLEV